MWGACGKIQRLRQLRVYDKNGDELSDKQMSYLELREISDQMVSVNVDLWKVRQDIAIEAEYSGTLLMGMRYPV